MFACKCGHGGVLMGRGLRGPELPPWLQKPLTCSLFRPLIPWLWSPGFSRSQCPDILGEGKPTETVSGLSASSPPLQHLVCVNWTHALLCLRRTVAWDSTPLDGGPGSCVVALIEEEGAGMGTVSHQPLNKAADADSWLSDFLGSGQPPGSSEVGGREAWQAIVNGVWSVLPTVQHLSTRQASKVKPW